MLLDANDCGNFFFYENNSDLYTYIFIIQRMVSVARDRESEREKKEPKKYEEKERKKQQIETVRPNGMRVVQKRTTVLAGTLYCEGSTRPASAVARAGANARVYIIIYNVVGPYASSQRWGIRPSPLPPAVFTPSRVR